MGTENAADSARTAESAAAFIQRALAEHADPAYRDFMVKLIPAVDRTRILGVRTPELRRIAKELRRLPDADEYLQSLPHETFEGNQIHAFAIGLESDYSRAVALYDAFLPYVDNWATCDQMPVAVLAKRADETLLHIDRWLASGHAFTMRFAIGVLMKLHLDERFDARLARKVADSRLPGAKTPPAPESDAYYVDMMRAWYFAEALVKQEACTLPYLERKGADALLDEWTRRKAIQKAIESRRVPYTLKKQLRSFR